MKKVVPIALALFFAPATGIAQRDAQKLGELWNSTYRDSVIRNYQTRIQDNARCDAYKKQMKHHGQRHGSAASGPFMMDMQSIIDSARADSCLHGVQPDISGHLKSRKQGVSKSNGPRNAKSAEMLNLDALKKDCDSAHEENRKSPSRENILKADSICEAFEIERQRIRDN